MTPDVVPKYLAAITFDLYRISIVQYVSTSVSRAVACTLTQTQNLP